MTVVYSYEIYIWHLTLTGRVFPRNAGSALLLLPKETSDGRLDALFLGCFVEGVLAAVAAAGVAALAILQAGQTVSQQCQRWKK